MIRKVVKQRETILIICEGRTDEAFFKFLRQMFMSQGHAAAGPKITIKDAGGMGGLHVCRTALREPGEYTHRVVVYDGDVDAPLAIKQEILAKGWSLIVIDQCIEALLLTLLQRRVPANSNACKIAMQAVTKASLMEVETYAAMLTQRRILEAKDRIPQLAEVLRHFGVA
ncbi:hypothetical protein [Amantichitinum ursilacus]|uniref:RloB-like protein n=1 Tax=Amantichitinum ursilacus TaxID=857265 RepID=A0A0N0GQL6_9NEIS|nr:hypothetical protein [Amantichitinum ursilacus]KPC55000.1 hypothetical protein WG78_00035 [Amantichitinum ursilacus]